MEEELQVDDINAGGETSWVAAGLRLEERKCVGSPGSVEQPS